MLWPTQPLEKQKMHSPQTQSNKDIYTVSQLSSNVRAVLEERFRTVWVTGEISNLVQPSSGHRYFSLKDKQSQVRCAMFRMSTASLKFKPENGQQVLIQAKVSLYEARGDFQLIAQYMEPVGDGALQIAFENLKNKLSTQGLFDPEHKKNIPALPKCIGVITSSTGAAIQDILKVLRRRFPSIPVILYPTLVQGNTAAPNIAQAIQTANQRQECDILLVSRGGGSLEDLWAFNEEQVALAIFASDIPIVTGIGHEIDFTIADLVADQRAATPSAAAELITPDQEEWQQRLTQLKQKIEHLLDHKLQKKTLILQGLAKRLRHPGQIIQEKMQQLDHIEQNLHQKMANKITFLQHVVAQHKLRLSQYSPIHRIGNHQTKLASLNQQLQHAIKNTLNSAQQSLSMSSQALQKISPLNTLQRGYTIISEELTGEIVTNANNVQVGDKIQATLAIGKITCRVENKTLPN